MSRESFETWAKNVFKYGTDAEYGIAKTAQQAAQAEMQKEWDAELFKQNLTLKQRNFKLEAEGSTILEHCKTLEAQLCEQLKNK